MVGEITESGARGKSKGALSGAAETISDAFRQGRDEGSSKEQDERERRPRTRKSTAARRKEREEDE
jgi:gas vesicle structural protein